MAASASATESEQPIWPMPARFDCSMTVRRMSALNVRRPFAKRRPHPGSRPPAATASLLPADVVPGPSLELTERVCPVCRTPQPGRLLAEANVDPEALGPLAFASRKPPELMHHRLLECPVCDTVYASPAPLGEGLERAYAEAAYDGAEESRWAARTYARLAQRVLAGVTAAGGALDIGTGDGAFLLELLR